MDGNPPSYEDTINVVNRDALLQNDDDRQRKYWLFLRTNFTYFDITITAFLLVSFVWTTFVRSYEVKLIDVQNLCNDSAYNQTHEVTNTGNVFVVVSILLVFCTVCLSSCLCTILGVCDKKKILTKILRRAWIVSVGYMVMCIYVFTLKTLIGAPAPYFFSNSTIYQHYCESNGAGKQIDTQELRMSFPSLFVALEWFSISFLVFYLDHFDISVGPHLTQVAIAGLFGTKCLYDGLILCESHENHYSDIIGGAIIGILIAAVTVRNLKGTVLRNLERMPIYAMNGTLMDSYCVSPQNLSRIREANGNQPEGYVALQHSNHPVRSFPPAYEEFEIIEPDPPPE